MRRLREAKMVPITSDNTAKRERRVVEIDRGRERGGWGLRVFNFELWFEEYAQPISMELGLKVGYEMETSVTDMIL